jgi:hypothetical protein
MRRPPNTPRLPLCEVSTNSRSGVVAAHDYVFIREYGLRCRWLDPTAVRIDVCTRSMCPEILAENGVANTDDAPVEPITVITYYYLTEFE